MSFSFVELAKLGLRVHYRRSAQPAVADGAPPSSSSSDKLPLLLLHGFMGSIFEFRHLFAAWEAQQRDVIAMDRPGSGLTTLLPSATATTATSTTGQQPIFAKEGQRVWGQQACVHVVIAFLDAIGVSKCVLVAHSMSGGLALLLATQHPERFAGHLMLAPAVRWPLSGLVWNTILSSNMLGSVVVPIWKLIMFTPNALGLLLRGNYYYAQPDTDDSWCSTKALEGLSASFADSVPAFSWEIARDVTAESTMMPPEQLATITVPVYIFGGTGDMLVAEADLHVLHKSLPNAKLHIFDKCRHKPHEEYYREIITMVDVWFAENHF